MAKVFVWASKDRMTVWTRSYERIRPSGMHERITIEEIRVRYPKTQKLMIREFGPIVVARNTLLINTKTGKSSPVRTRYWTVSQSGFGGQGTKNDVLGGFWSGMFHTYYARTKIQATIKDLERQGFKII